jgi:hypothetical protein
VGGDSVSRARTRADEILAEEAASGRLPRLANALQSRSYLTGEDIDQIPEGGDPS